MKINNQMHTGTLEVQVSSREQNHGNLARKLAAEGIVLLRNEGLLPLKASSSVALFGAGASKTVKGGIGSGDVNNRKSVSIYEGLKEAGVTIKSEDWLNDYDECYKQARNEWKLKILEDAKHVENPFDAYAANPFVLPKGRKITEDDIKGADVAVYVISRISGEGKDRSAIEEDYYLSQREKEELLYLREKNIATVLILNAGGPIELTDILEKAENIKAVLNISQPGQEGGHAVADVLLGKCMPGGRLTTTWARHYGDYPYGETFGHLNGNLEEEEYREGIYVGYRYFDSFDVKPLFPFGYGLTYTSFDVKFNEISICNNSVEVDVTVKNTGNTFPGREVVQVYVTLPQTGVHKEYHRLAGFAKSNVLEPGEEQHMTIVIEQKQLAIYSETMHAWIIEKGFYGIEVGKHCADLKLEAVLNVENETILEKTRAICPRQKMFDELGKSEAAVKKVQAVLNKMNDSLIPVLEFVPEAEKAPAVKYHYEADKPVDDLVPLLFGNITEGASTLGSAGIRVPGSAGETTEALEEKYGVPSLIMADGPAGLRLRQSYEVDKASNRVYGVGVLGSLENGFLEDIEHHENADMYYQYCTAFPVGTALAQTWDYELLEQFGEAVAEEMNEFHVNLWLAPGMNIHRNPLCGRNFEYYSEDPLMAGTMAAAVTTGVQKRERCGVTIKHFACNNQEDNRMGVNSCVSERVLREIYCRGFEIAVKKSNPAAIMSSYNLINGIHAANNRDLCTVLAREEWGFDGIIMSDWNTTVPEDGSIPWQCAAAGNDIIMPGNPMDEKNIREALDNGLLAEETVRVCAGRIIDLIHRLGCGMESL